MTSLSVTQQLALEQLHAVTASTTQAARERDERILRDCGWNVQTAAEIIFTQSDRPAFDAGPSRSSTMEYAEPGDVHPPPGSRRLSGSHPRPRANSTGQTSVLWLLFALPVRIVVGAITGTWYFLARTFIPLSAYPRLPRFLLPPSGPSSSHARPFNPTATSLSFVRDLETFTGASSATNNLPDFYIGPYREFMSNVRKEGKVGVVILVCGEHEDDEEFKREVLCDEELVRIFKEKDVMVWGADIRSREGCQVSQTLLTTTYPSITFTSLLPPPVQSQSSSTPKLSIITQISGPPSTTTSASSIIQTLTTSVLPRATPFLNRLKRERLTLEEARHLREEQDRAFKEAERRDGERMRAERQAKELERTKAERAQREAEERAKRISDRQEWRRYARKHLLPPSSGPIRVALRTPFGAERNIRNFTPGPSTLPLFIYAETLLIPSTDSPDTDPDSPPPGYDHEWDFQIVTTYPRRNVDRVETEGETIWETVKAAGGALVAEKEEGSVWGDAERAAAGEDSDEEIVE